MARHACFSFIRKPQNFLAVEWIDSRLLMKNTACDLWSCYSDKLSTQSKKCRKSCIAFSQTHSGIVLYQVSVHGQDFKQMGYTSFWRCSVLLCTKEFFWMAYKYSSDFEPLEGKKGHGVPFRTELQFTTKVTCLEDEAISTWSTIVQG